MVKIIFKTKNGEITAEANVGDTLLEVAQTNKIKLFGGCDGAGVCGTCRVSIDQQYAEVLNKKTLEEEVILEILPSSSVNDRLGCQVIVSEAMDGMIVTVL
jgi:2Fe-2S ferredoxin